MDNRMFKIGKIILLLKIKIGILYSFIIEMKVSLSVGDKIKIVPNMILTN